jgi:TonB family protein
MRLCVLSVCAALLFLFAVPCRGQTTGTEKVSSECKNRKALQHRGPSPPYKFLPGESYKRPPTVKFQVNEDGTVSNMKLIRSSGVKDIDKKLIKAASTWKFKAVPGCIIDSEATILIHWD